MTPEQADKIIKLVENNNELLSEGINLLKKQIALFEQYDAQSLFEEEEIREQAFSQRIRGR